MRVSLALYSRAPQRSHVQWGNSHSSGTTTCYSRWAVKHREVERSLQSGRAKRGAAPSLVCQTWDFSAYASRTWGRWRAAWTCAPSTRPPTTEAAPLSSPTRAPPVREQAVLAIGALGPAAADATLTDALRDPAEPVRVAAVRVLHARGQTDDLIEALDWLPAQGQTRRLVVQALLVGKPPGAARAVAGTLLRAEGEAPLSDADLALVRTLIDAEENPDVANDVVDGLLSSLVDEREAVVRPRRGALDAVGAGQHRGTDRRASGRRRARPGGLGTRPHLRLPRARAVGRLPRSPRPRGARPERGGARRAARHGCRRAVGGRHPRPRPLRAAPAPGRLSTASAPPQRCSGCRT